MINICNNIFYLNRQKQIRSTFTSIINTTFNKMQQNILTNNTDIEYFISTNLFDLFIKFTHQILDIKLYNYLQKIIYSKQYNQEDIGKQINKKVQLNDIIFAFNQSHQNNKYYNKRENIINNSQSTEDNKKQYCYGDKFQNKFSTLSVLQNGKIIIETKISKNGIQYVYQSQLSLRKVEKNKSIQFYENIAKQQIQKKWTNKYQQLQQILKEKQKQLEKLRQGQNNHKIQTIQSQITTDCCQKSEVKQRKSYIQYKSDINSNNLIQDNIILSQQQLTNFAVFLSKIDINQIKSVLLKFLNIQQNNKTQKNKQIYSQQNSLLTKSQIEYFKQDNILSNYKPNMQTAFMPNTDIQKLKAKITNLEKMISEYQKIESQQNNKLIRYKAFLPKALIDIIQPQRLQQQSNLSCIGNNKQVKQQQYQPIQNHDLNHEFQQNIRTLIQQQLLKMLKFKRNSKKQNHLNEDNSHIRSHYQQQNSTTQSLNNLFDSKSQYYKWFKITGNTIRYIGGQGIQNLFGSWCQLLINQVIPSNQSYCFSIKIVKTDRRGIVIGVIDRKKQRHNKNPTQGNAIGYYGRWGKLTPSGKEQGTGFSEGQTVKVTVNLHSHTIKWSVHNQTRAKIKNDILGDPNRQFVPYIQMRHTGDQIMWVGSSNPIISQISE